MSAIDLVLPRLKAEEGYRSTAYHDSRGFLTIGYGFNVDAGCPEPLASVILQWQATQAEAECSSRAWYQACDEVRQSVLIDMAFNMGLAKLLGFTKMLAACVVHDWQTAHDEMLNSAWASQVGKRAQTLASIMLTGVNE